MGGAPTHRTPGMAECAPQQQRHRAQVGCKRLDAEAVSLLVGPLGKQRHEGVGCVAGIAKSTEEPRDVLPSNGTQVRSSVGQGKQDRSPYGVVVGEGAELYEQRVSVVTPCEVGQMAAKQLWERGLSPLG